MYWPLGAPRIYASSRNKRKVGQDGVEGEEYEASDDNASRAILGLRVSRNGHLFATITEIVLTVWQSNVCALNSTIADSD